jgi:hypothetical protein
MGWTGWMTLLPSLVLYGFLAWSIVRFCKRRETLYLLAAAIPFVWWASVAVSGSVSKAEAEREYAAVTTAALPDEIPDTIVFEGKAAFPRPNDIRKFFGFRYAIYVRTSAGRGQPVRTRILKYDLRDRTAARPELLDRLPQRYVVFRAKEASSYWNDGQVKAADGGPFEMRYVDGSRDSLVGFRYRRYVAVPMFPPMLSLDGWASAGNSVAAKDLRVLMLEFMSSSLRHS